MKRKAERNLSKAAAVWDVLVGLVTMFGYYPWFEEQGIGVFQSNDNYDYLNSSLVVMFSKVVLIVALATILMGIVSWIVAKDMKDNQIEKGRMRWLIACSIIHLVIYDVVGILFYLLASLLYISKNKALKMKKMDVGYN
ncbi:hypothetical protein [Enterococcus sp. LJL90]